MNMCNTECNTEIVTNFISYIHIQENKNVEREKQEIVTSRKQTNWIFRVVQQTGR